MLVLYLPPPSLPTLRATSKSTTSLSHHPRRSPTNFFLHRLAPQVTATSRHCTDAVAEYNISEIASIYRKKPLVVLRRVLQIVSTFGKWVSLCFLDSVTGRSEKMFQVRAAELRKILVELGPAYIKIAQAISSRADLVPPSYVDELSLLQDQITPYSNEAAFDTIEKELGQPIDEIFSEITPEPVAAASLGQVYKARLHRTGEVVAVKVQRPGVQATVSLDIFILRYVAGLVRRAGNLNTDLQAVVDEWASGFFWEMDYKREAMNGIKFRQLYGCIKDVLVPKMYEEQTTCKVLVMEWVEGKKLSEVKDIYLIEVAVYCYFKQFLEYGFYHADPHPGNVLRTYDGKLAYLDFGMMGEFKQELGDGFMEACLHLINHDYDALAKDFVTLGLLPAMADHGAVTKALTGVFQNAVAKGVQNISFGDLLRNLGTTMHKFKFQIPSYYFHVIRSLAVSEGIAVSLIPDYKVLGSLYPWIARKVLTDNSPKLKSSLLALLYTDGMFRIDRLEFLITESLRAGTVPGKALVKKDIDDNDSRVVFKKIISFTLTEKGAFVREILLQEYAKGLDALGLATMDYLTAAVTANLPFASSLSFSSVTDEDIINLRTSRRLLLLLSGNQKNANSSMGVKEGCLYKNQNVFSYETSLAPYQLASVQELLQLVYAIPELPPNLRQQLFHIPADLAGKLISRIAARTIRRFLL